MAKSKYNDFRDLEVWQRCRDIKKKVWQLCKNFPKEEKYRLSDQMIRTSRSSTACIAEGYGRFHYQENINSVDNHVDHFPLLVPTLSVGTMGRKGDSTLYQRGGGGIGKQSPEPTQLTTP